MTQEEVLEFLKKNKDRWITSKKISVSLNITPNTIRDNLRRMRIRKEILFKEDINPRVRVRYLYKYKK